MTWTRLVRYVIAGLLLQFVADAATSNSHDSTVFWWSMVGVLILYTWNVE